MINLAMLLPHIDGAGGAIAMLPAAPTHAEQLQTARDEAAAAATAAAEALFAMRLEQTAAQHVEELRHTRQRWCDEEAATLADRLLGQLSEAEHRLADAMEAVLAPFIESLLPRASVAELRRSLLSALGSDLQQQITLHGPEDLVTTLAASLAASGAGNIRIGAIMPELQAECSGLQVTTRLAAWCKAMREADHG